MNLLFTYSSKTIQEVNLSKLIVLYVNQLRLYAKKSNKYDKGCENDAIPDEWPQRMFAYEGDKKMNTAKSDCKSDKCPHSNSKPRNLNR